MLNRVFELWGNGCLYFVFCPMQDVREKRSFFNAFYFAINVGSLIASLVVVYIQENVSWVIGFGIPTVRTAFLQQVTQSDTVLCCKNFNEGFVLAAAISWFSQNASSLGNSYFLAKHLILRSQHFHTLVYLRVRMGRDKHMDMGQTFLEYECQTIFRPLPFVGGFFRAWLWMLQ